MDKQQLITGVYINCPGDETVGIFSAEWQINELSVNLSAEDLEQFRSGLKALFDNFIAENCSVQTFEERIELQIPESEKYGCFHICETYPGDDGAEFCSDCGEMVKSPEHPD